MATTIARHEERPMRQLLSLPTFQSLNLNSTVFSPVNELGSFEFDRVLKSGKVLKRRKRTNTWDSVRLVLRPNLLSIYTDEQETKLKHQVNLSDITAVALRKNSKRKGDHQGVFGIFSPSRNFHLEAETEFEARSWVSVLKEEARIDAQNEEMTMTSPSGAQSRFVGFGRASHSAGRMSRGQGALTSASSDALETILQSSSRREATEPLPIPRYRHRPSYDTSEFSGTDLGSYSDVSETPVHGRSRNMSFSSRYAGPGSSSRSGSVLHNHEQFESSMAMEKDGKNFYMMGSSNDEERVLWHGYLQCLKNNRGVRQWKRYWVVLRAKHLALYKSDEEYAALLIIPLSTILDAVETDPVSKGKDSCMQVITDERSYRFCCAGEEDLSKWLGALKSTLAQKKKKRKDGHS